MTNTGIEVKAPADAPERPNGAGANGDAGDAARKTLINDIVSQIRTDSFIALAKLEGESRGRRVWRGFCNFCQHQAVLLIIGFIITGYFGTQLANSWQSQEWERQQLRLLDIEGLKLKYALIEELTKAVGQRNAAAKAIIDPLLKPGGSDGQLIKDEAEPIQGWHKADNEWRVQSKILELKLATHVRNQEAAPIFKEIVADEGLIAANIKRVEAAPAAFHLRGSQEEELKQQALKVLGETNGIITKTDGKLKRLASLIAEEGQSEVKNSKPEGH
jgi:hypothetical protein